MGTLLASAPLYEVRPTTTMELKALRASEEVQQ
jgi:hypothetical protein